MSFVRDIGEDWDCNPWLDFCKKRQDITAKDGR